MHNDIINWKDKIPMLIDNGSVVIWTMFIEKLLSQAKEEGREEAIETLNSQEVWILLQEFFYDAFNYGKSGKCSREQRHKVNNKFLDQLKSHLTPIKNLKGKE